MKTIISAKHQNAVERMFQSLDRVEQTAQAIRWRMTSLPDDLSNISDEIDTLSEESGNVAKLNGELTALKHLLDIKVGEEPVGQVVASTGPHFEIQSWNIEVNELSDSLAVINVEPEVSDSTPGSIDDASFGAKMKCLRAKSVTLCREVAEKLKVEAGVTNVVHDQEKLKGYAYVRAGVIHVPAPTTRRRLYIFAHECGHVALNHVDRVPRHRQELEAEQWAHQALRRHGVAVPKKLTQWAKKYVAYKIHQAVVRGAKQIDKESYQYSKDHATPSVRRWLTAGRILCDLSLGKSALSQVTA